MNRTISCTAIFIFLMTLTACTAQEPIYPCFEGTELPAGLAELIGDDLTDCSLLEGQTCNSAVTLDEACLQSSQQYSGRWPAICEKASQVAVYDAVIGTCQPPDVHGEPCLEDTDCRSDLNLMCIMETGAEEGYCEPDGYTQYTRLVYIYNRLPELSLTAFFQYWQNVHAPLVVEKADILGIRGYNQLHAGNAAMNQILQASRGTLPAYDGVAEIYLDRDVFAAALETPAGLQALQDLIDDKQNFADLSTSALWLAEEHILRNEPRIPGQPVTIFTWVGSSLPSLTPAEFQDYYVNHHGAFVVTHAEHLGIHQYIQIHTTLDDPLNETLRTLHGTIAPYAVHAEFIWDFGQMISPFTAPVMGLIAEDETNFIDFTNSAIWIADEHIIIPVE